ncbi:MAG: BlaI/MecI/CopY family transcriptional regulator [Lachnospiraceae bacterium]|nr:BlaI/MecI/CopY family transcriptional regulator [Lachnospiraceae bacterium]
MQKKSKEDFTVSELAIIKLFWEKQTSLTAAEIIENLPELNLLVNSLYVILRGMMRKGLIDMDGQVRRGKRYAKTYKAIISREDFATLQMYKLFPNVPKRDRFLGILASMVKLDGDDEETISLLEEYVQKKRKERESNGY